MQIHRSLTCLEIKRSRLRSLAAGQERDLVRKLTSELCSQPPGETRIQVEQALLRSADGLHGRCAHHRGCRLNVVGRHAVHPPIEIYRKPSVHKSCLPINKMNAQVAVDYRLIKSVANDPDVVVRTGLRQFDEAFAR